MALLSRRGCGIHGAPERKLSVSPMIPVACTDGGRTRDRAPFLWVVVSVLINGCVGSFGPHPLIPQRCGFRRQVPSTEATCNSARRKLQPLSALSRANKFGDGHRHRRSDRSKSPGGNASPTRDARSCGHDLRTWLDVPRHHYPGDALKMSCTDFTLFERSSSPAAPDCSPLPVAPVPHHASADAVMVARPVGRTAKTRSECKAIVVCLV